LYLLADFGQLNVLSEIAGVGDHSQVEQHTIEVDIGGTHCRVLDLVTLIAAQKALNSPKDRQAVMELEAIRERLRDLD
jgi:hypothetical protein